MKGVQHLLAAELAVDPVIREYVRKRFRRLACVQTKPTDRGAEIRDPVHMYGPISMLVDKPLDSFGVDNDFSWLFIEKAEEEGLLEVRIEVPPEALQLQLVKPMVEQYQSSGTSDVAAAWNALREGVVKELVQSLAGVFASEARAILSRLSKDLILRQISDEAWRHASAPPWRPEESAEEASPDEMGEIRLMAGLWGPGGDQPSTCFVVTDMDGNLVDMLFCGQFSGHLRFGSNDRAGLFHNPKMSHNAMKLKTFMLMHQPQICVLGGGGLDTTKLRDILYEISYDIVQNHARELRKGAKDVKIVYTDDSIAKLWETTSLAVDEMGDHVPYVRRAVALCRQLIDPLAVFAAVCSGRKDLLAVNCHPYQSSLTEEDRVRAVEEVLQTAVNQVGVDLNLAVQQSWRAPALHYVSGLGPRKVPPLLRIIRASGGVCPSRRWLYDTSLHSQDKRPIPKKVFVNAAASLKVVNRAADDEEGGERDALDVMRAHPESYKYANTLAEQVCEGTEMADQAEDKQLRFAMENPDSIDRLNLEAYAEYIRDTPTEAGGWKLSTLIDLSMEYRDPYGEIRAPWQEPNESEEFKILLGDIAVSLKRGLVVQAVVKGVRRLPDGGQGVFVELDSGLIGLIEEADFHIEGNVVPHDLQDFVGPGDSITARIKDVDPTQQIEFRFEKHWRITLVKTASDKEKDGQYRRFWEQYYCTDPYYREVTEEEQLGPKKKRNRKQFTKRPISHPLFKNISLAEANRLLENGEAGECLLRPSSKGTDRIVLTMKYHDGGVDRKIYKHIDIKEGPKKGAAHGAHLQLGTPLTVQNCPETFEDLDEVVARYVEPLSRHLKEVRRHRKFREGNLQEIEDYLQGTKAKMRAQARKSAALGSKGGAKEGIAYCIAPDYINSGNWLLCLIVNTTFRYDSVKATYKGFNYRGGTYDSLDKVFNQLKRMLVAKDRGDRAGYRPPAQPVPAPMPAAPPMPAQPAYGYPPQPVQPVGMPGQDMRYVQPMQGVAYGVQPGMPPGQPLPPQQAYPGQAPMRPPPPQQAYPGQPMQPPPPQQAYPGQPMQPPPPPQAYPGQPMPPQQQPYGYGR